MCCCATAVIQGRRLKDVQQMTLTFFPSVVQTYPASVVKYGCGQNSCLVSPGRNSSHFIFAHQQDILIFSSLDEQRSK